MLTNSHILTAEGQNLVTRSLVENKKIDFLYYKAGNGDVNSIDAIKLLKDIAGALIKRFDVALISKISTSTTNISGQYDNTGIVTSQQVKEYGLFAKLEGDSTEILFSYQGLGEGFILPAYSGTLITQIVDFTITMTQDVGVVVRFNPSALVDMQTFFEELDKKVDKTSVKNDSFINTPTDILSSSASRNLFETGAGGKWMGIIEDGGLHEPHDTNFWTSRTLPGQFRCVVSNSDRYVDSGKWLPIDDNSNASKLKNLTTVEAIGIAVPNFSGCTVTRRGNQVNLAVDTGTGLNGKDSGAILFNIPTGFRPKYDQLFCTMGSSDNSQLINKILPFSISANGNVTLYAIPEPVTHTYAYYCNISYFT